MKTRRIFFNCLIIDVCMQVDKKTVRPNKNSLWLIRNIKNINPQYKKNHILEIENVRSL